LGLETVTQTQFTLHIQTALVSNKMHEVAAVSFVCLSSIHFYFFMQPIKIFSIILSMNTLLSYLWQTVPRHINSMDRERYGIILREKYRYLYYLPLLANLDSAIKLFPFIRSVFYTDCPHILGKVQFSGFSYNFAPGHYKTPADCRHRRQT
jgi:hypothetical protein